MKTGIDIENQFELELKHWFPKQCHDVFTQFYLYYIESTHEQDGGIVIMKEQPANSDYKLATPDPIPRNLEMSQIQNLFRPILMRLPVLSIKG